ncbi:copper homeostasis protein CutC [Sediminibacterium soli]|uniref:copper homeostasis protein CutC n=1 Tax=Sediminibacterium soli TaxID=2698829 RepID=UPI00137AC07D|nr:copper homeostasis protein CutC [Sediminibacterium soli]NCI46330.1 copper homeostasis protein CutC [Sediminibacterium soli]
MLEIAVFNIHSALQAADAGADRLELCENPAEGGTTPSYGTLKTVREKIALPVFPIIRPRGGDFLYDDAEFAAMKQDIRLCKELQFEGVVIGLLHADGSIDTRRTSELADIAYPMEVTFHRAFDRCSHPLNALEAVIGCGCSRILTSGQVPNAFDGKELIRQLVEKADGRITIMPGSGVRSANIRELMQYTGAREMHSSARINLPSAMQFKAAGMKEQLQHTGIDETELRAMKLALQPN